MRTTFALLMFPAILAAQMPGVPVLQNAWATPGLVMAINASGGSGSTTWGGAVAWAPATARFQLSGGAGSQSVSGGGSHGVYGLRAAVPLAQMAGGKLGIGAFVGYGGAGKMANDSTTITSMIPAGVSIGYRQAMGTRGFSIYATPSVQRGSAASGSATNFRVSTGLDIGISKSLGFTGGMQFGGSGSLWGVGGSYVLGKR